MKQNKFCTNCGTLIQSDNKFCGQCGLRYIEQPQDYFCPNCGIKGTPGDKFCRKCGVTVSWPTAEQEKLNEAEVELNQWRKKHPSVIISIIIIMILVFLAISGGTSLYYEGS